MKIALIHGQNHKGSSYHIGRLLADKLGTGNQITEFFLPRDLEHFCIGCYRCIEDETQCPFYAQKQPIMEAVEDADLLIFTTPTYCLWASASMKAFLDLTFTYWMSHRPRQSMFQKKAAVISTAAGVGMKSAMKDVATALFYWGVPKIQQYGIGVQAMNWEQVSDAKKEKIQKDTEKLAKRLLTQKVHVGIKTKLIFHVMRMMQKTYDDASVEKQYWKEKGWLAKTRPWKQC